MAYGDFKDLARRTALDKILRGTAFNITKYPKYDGYRRSISETFCFVGLYIFFLIKKTSVSGVKSMSNEQLAEELLKPIITKFKKRRVYSSFRDNT